MSDTLKSMNAQASFWQHEDTIEGKVEIDATADFALTALSIFTQHVGEFLIEVGISPAQRSLPRFNQL